MTLIMKTTLLATLTIAATLTSSQQDTPSADQDGESGVPCELTPVVELADTAATPRDIDLALCLDTSGSMQGLIESAKQRLWALVNELALAEPTPRLRVALLTYGSPGYGAESGWVRTAVALTDDLDMVSLKLFELSTSGGEEYVARVTRAASAELDWSTDPLALKMIVVAGNESAEQDMAGGTPSATLEAACRSAIEQGIVVHSLYCAQAGRVQQRMNSAAGAIQQVSTGATSASPATPAARPLDAIAIGWKRIATLADGAFAMIDQNRGVVVIESPFDDRLVALSTSLNATYIPYGNGAGWNLNNQIVQDVNAVGLNNEAAASRAQAKASKLYFCSWDLIDSLIAERLTFEEIETESLPEDLRKLSSADLKARIDGQREARGKIQTDITAVSAEREAWLTTKRTELGTDESRAFDFPLRKAFRELAEARGFRFAQPNAVNEAKSSASPGEVTTAR